jgi:hypothetical protein
VSTKLTIRHLPSILSYDRCGRIRTELTVFARTRWDKSELHDLSRRGQAELGAEKRRTAWLAWTRDQRGICGVRWLTRRVVVFVMFFFCAAYVAEVSSIGATLNLLASLRKCLADVVASR